MDLLGLALLLRLLLLLLLAAPLGRALLLAGLRGLAFALGRLRPCARLLARLRARRGRRGLGLLALLFLLLGLVFRPQQLDDGHLRGVAAARPQAQDARVAARPRGVARAQVVEQLLDHGDVVDLARD